MQVSNYSNIQNKQNNRQTVGYTKMIYVTQFNVNEILVKDNFEKITEV